MNRIDKINALKAFQAGHKEAIMEIVANTPVVAVYNKDSRIYKAGGKEYSETEFNKMVMHKKTVFAIPDNGRDRP